MHGTAAYRYKMYAHIFLLVDPIKNREFIFEKQEPEGGKKQLKQTAGIDIQK
ncbi:hypothetical protein JCM15548_11358 [Geofilum rubicundum JCM 15548]|uniref:Uncharacterized protein n=1 Tax=Geofilum rubicundum JCM 15548 TaxID=1236989 RepID=A0A0E9LV62_9BACT|nr:hypothetical protein JCM15548_11358 [Geofilum rubicundum JCM 15548]